MVISKIYRHGYFSNTIIKIWNNLDVNFVLLGI